MTPDPARQPAAQSEGAVHRLRKIYDDLVAVLCDPQGEVSIRGSEGDKHVIKYALTQLISMCIKADPPSQPAKQSEGAAKTVADQWRDYLLGGCSDPDNCNLCRTEKWAKAVGMHHAGIPWNKPPSQPAEQSTAPKREQSKSNATPRDQAIYKGIADNYHATVAIEQSTDKDARPVEKIMGIINETGDPKHTFTRAVMMERLRKSQEATNWQYVSFAEFDKIAARFALLERAVERISSYADHYIDADLIAQIREALK